MNAQRIALVSYFSVAPGPFGRRRHPKIETLTPIFLACLAATSLAWGPRAPKSTSHTSGTPPMRVCVRALTQTHATGEFGNKEMHSHIFSGRDPRCGTRPLAADDGGACRSLRTAAPRFLAASLHCEATVVRVRAVAWRYGTVPLFTGGRPFCCPSSGALSATPANGTFTRNEIPLKVHRHLPLAE